MEARTAHLLLSPPTDLLMGAARDAQAASAALRDIYESLGAQVLTLEGGSGAMVLLAGCAVVLDGKAVLSRSIDSARAQELTHAMALFETLKARGEIDAIFRTPPGVYFDGARDAVFDAARGLMWMGYGQRSCRAAHHTLEQVFGVGTASLELADPRFTHLDTCFCLLADGDILYHPPAFSEDGRARIVGLAGERLIQAGAEDASQKAVNALCLGRDVVMSYCSAGLRARLEVRGYRVHEVPLAAFDRLGAAAHGLTLRLDETYSGRIPRTEAATA